MGSTRFCECGRPKLYGDECRDCYELRTSRALRESHRRTQPPATGRVPRSSVPIFHRSMPRIDPAESLESIADETNERKGRAVLPD